jgi:hypothetical protein
LSRHHSDSGSSISTKVGKAIKPSLLEEQDELSVESQARPKRHRRLVRLGSRSKFLAFVTCSWLLLVVIIFALAQKLFNDVWPLGQTFIRWDAGWYYSIAEGGYYTGYLHGQANQVFFPLYPILIAIVQRCTHLPAVAVGVSMSLIAFVASLIIFYDLVAVRYGEPIARWATVLLAFNPFALFFSLMYTESLFLLLSLLVFWLIQKNQWWWAALVAGVATATRASGVFLGLIVVAQWAWSQQEQRNHASKRFTQLSEFAALTILSLSGLVLFCTYLQYHNHDALAFVHLQRYWGRPGISNLLPEWNNVTAQIREHVKGYFDLLPYILWYGATFIGIIGGILLIKQRDYWFALYVALSLLLPLSSGTVGSMDRYVMVLFPLYIAFARALRQRERFLVAAISCVGFCGMWWLYFNPRYLFFG